MRRRFWVGEYLLLFLELERGVRRFKGFAFAHTFAVAPVGVELPLLFKHRALVTFEILAAVWTVAGTPMDTG